MTLNAAAMPSHFISGLLIKLSAKHSIVLYLKLCSVFGLCSGYTDWEVSFSRRVFLGNNVLTLHNAAAVTSTSCMRDGMTVSHLEDIM